MTQTNRKRKKQEPAVVDPLVKLQALNEELKASGYEVVIRKLPTKDVVSFDFGLVFTADSKEVGLYVDEDLRDILVSLAKENGQVLVKVNWFSPDVMVVTPADNPDPLQNQPDTDTAQSLLGDTESDETT